MKIKFKYIFLIILCLLGCLTIYFFANKTFLSNTYKSNSTNISITVPKSSIFQKESGMYIVRLISYRNKNAIEKEINTILDTYELINCNGEKVYFKDNHIILRYEVTNGIFTKNILIEYEPSDYCELNYSFYFKDETTTCDNEIELFYEDESYYYYFPCTKNESTFVIFDGGIKMTVKDALKEQRIHIKDLEESFIKITKKSK